jgi:hypothetical protein
MPGWTGSAPWVARMLKRALKLKLKLQLMACIFLAITTITFTITITTFVIISITITTIYVCVCIYTAEYSRSFPVTVIFEDIIYTQSMATIYWLKYTRTSSHVRLFV